LTADGVTYSPIGLGSMSAESREAGLKASAVEVRGHLSEDKISLPDVLGGVYRGAVVRHRVVDWRRPWVSYYGSTRWVAQVDQDGDHWVASLEGRTHQLQQANGGRFGGAYIPSCPYVLGGVHCKADVVGWTQMGGAAFGNATAGTPITMTDSGAAFTPGAMVGHWAVVYDHAAILPRQLRRVIANTGTQITVATPFLWDPRSGDGYFIGPGPAVSAVVDTTTVQFAAPFSGSYGDDIYRDGEIRWTSGANAGVGHVSPVMGYRASSRQCTLLLLPPFPVEVGDTGILVVGCDGLAATCKGKFDNLVNFGGVPFDVGADERLDPPAGTE